MSAAGEELPDVDVLASLGLPAASLSADLECFQLSQFRETFGLALFAGLGGVVRGKLYQSASKGRDCIKLSRQAGTNRI